MSHRIDPLDAPLSRLCTLAEETARVFAEVAVLREAVDLPHLVPDEVASSLRTLAQEGRAADTRRQRRSREAAVAEARAREAAEAAMAQQGTVRAELDSLSRGEPVAEARADLLDLRRLFRGRHVRAATQLRVVREVAFRLEQLAELSPPVHALLASRGLVDRVDGQLRALEEAVAARHRAYRARRGACEAAAACQTALRARLRRLRGHVDYLVSCRGVPASLFAHLATRAAGPTASQGHPESIQRARETDGGGLQEPEEPGTSGGHPGTSGGGPGKTQAVGCGTPGQGWTGPEEGWKRPEEPCGEAPRAADPSAATLEGSAAAVGAGARASLVAGCLALPAERPPGRAD